MKYLLTAMICIFSVAQGMAQKSNLIFFTEGGENFTLFVNGVKQNEAPASNVRADGINAESALIKVQFEEPGAPVLQQGMMIEPGMEMTALIKKNNKGKYVFRPVSAVPAEQAPEKSETVAVQPAPAQTASTSSNTVTTTTTTSVPTAASTVGVNVTEGMTGVNMSVNVNVNEQQTQSMETAMVTTTTTTSEPAYVAPQPVAEPSAPAAVDNTCTTPMTTTDFESARKAISNKSFAEDRMTVSKQILKANCLSVKQVKAVMEIFSYEESRLEFAKLAYPKTVDKGNYYQVNDAFSFSGSISELDKFLAAQ